MRYEAKWLEHKDNVKGRKQTTSTTSSPIGEDNDELSYFVELERTLGRKVQNELLKKRKRQDDMVPSLSTKLDEIKEKKRQMYEEKKERERIIMEEKHKEAEERQEEMCIASKEQLELIRLKIEKNEIEMAKVENEIMTKELSTLDPEQQEFIRLSRFEILESHRSRGSS